MNEELLAKEKVQPTLPKREDPLSESEKKVRKDWLLAFFLYSALTPLVALGCLFWGLLYNPEMDLPLMWTLIGASIVGTIVGGAPMYFFAYVKKGTKWIGLVVFLSPLRTLVDLIKEFPQGALEWVFQIIFIAAFIYFWIHCKKLYDLNHILKRRKEVGGSDELIQAQP